MACFLVPVAEAVITTAVYCGMKSREKKAGLADVKYDRSQFESAEKSEKTGKIPFTRKLKWLNNMLWGGSALLAFEHLWHGEIVPYFPFLTAVSNGETTEMLSEMGSTGVMMAAIVTAAWAGMVAVSSLAEKKVLHAEKQAQESA